MFVLTTQTDTIFYDNCKNRIESFFFLMPNVHILYIFFIILYYIPIQLNIFLPLVHNKVNIKPQTFEYFYNIYVLLF